MEVRLHVGSAIAGAALLGVVMLAASAQTQIPKDPWPATQPTRVRVVNEVSVAGIPDPRELIEIREEG